VGEDFQWKLRWIHPPVQSGGDFFLLNTLLATFGYDWLWSYLMPIGILGVVFLSHAGRAWVSMAF